MSKIALQGNASGTATFTVQPPATNSNRTLTLPDLSGTLTVSPAFMSVVSTTTYTISTTLPGDGTTPLITEGTEIITGTITPVSGTSKIKITCHFGSVGSSVSANYSMFVNNTYVIGDRAAGTTYQLITAEYVMDSAGAGTPMTISVRVGRDSATGTVYVSRFPSSTLYGASDTKIVLTAEEKFV